MNVSKEADCAFVEALKTEDPNRHSRLLKNVRRDSPSLGMDESQALTNFMLGLPTGSHRFEVVAGKPIEPVSVTVESVDGTRRGGRPRLQISRADRASRLRQQKREHMQRVRSGSTAVTVV
ncbi:MAG TPA: hypothetical protein VMB47_11385 [Candidatus Aquilonibacter sp.]|nr:hypothetical protein [Candidatus Aquilonibacter sp.]